MPQLTKPDAQASEGPARAQTLTRIDDSDSLIDAGGTRSGSHRLRPLLAPNGPPLPGGTVTLRLLRPTSRDLAATPPPRPSCRSWEGASP
jgi:hypothetical protein